MEKITWSLIGGVLGLAAYLALSALEGQLRRQDDDDDLGEHQADEKAPGRGSGTEGLTGNTPAFTPHASSITRADESIEFDAPPDRPIYRAGAPSLHWIRRHRPHP